LVAFGVVRGRFAGREPLLPICGLLRIARLAVQQDGIIKGRYRLPVDPIIVAALIVLAYRKRLRRRTLQI
jgi:hypothetical protein